MDRLKQADLLLERAVAELSESNREGYFSGDTVRAEAYAHVAMALIQREMAEPVEEENIED